ncbi:MAG: glycosyl hydrolase family 65 protein [Puniceicoccaceae bacterium]
MRWLCFISLVLLTALNAPAGSPEIPSFPGAEGAGGLTPGGRGGRVLFVTNLQDRGPGSFRAAVEAAGPRIVVFRVSGRIQLESPVEIEHPYLTVAGQTAPGDGICISGETVSINAEHVIIRYLRFRRGSLERRDDALNAVHSPGNVIIDHCSFSWGLDENVSLYRYMVPDGEGGFIKKPIENLTIQWCISSEGLNLHNHAFGATWGGRNASFHHNLFANNTGRIPSIGWGDHIDFRNNVLFNWRHRNIDGGDSSSRINIIANAYKAGPATRPGDLQFRIAKPEVFRSFKESDQSGQWYISENLVFGYPDISADNWNGGVQFEDGVPDQKVAAYVDKMRQADPVPMVRPLVHEAADAAYAAVLAGAGATRPVRDPVDRRIIDEVASGEPTYGNGIINTPEEVGGWPEYRSLTPVVDRDNDGMADAWERRFALNWNNPADYVHDPDGDGYGNLEEYINGTQPRINDLETDSGQSLTSTEISLEETLRRHVEFFNANDPERIVNLVSNRDSMDWLKDSIPLFECSDSEIEEIYYFRWWALRKHLKVVGDYFAYTEFIELDTKAPFIPPERTIASALGHHFRETRWLSEQKWDDSYIRYWLQGKGGEPQGHFHRYSSWLIESLWHRAMVTGDWDDLLELYPLLLADYERWKEEKQLQSGLYWQYDVWDAMEESISGSRHEKNLRPTINSYMYGNARALVAMARLAGDEETASDLEVEAAELRERVLVQLWNEERSFFEVRSPEGGFANVREAIGFIPWYFHLPPDEAEYGEAWKQLVDPEGFWAPWGLTTAERRHPEFRSHGVGTCEWDGAIWPYATSQTLHAMGNLLRDYEHTPVTRDDYFDAFVTYTRSQYYDGIPHIGEYQDETTGQWLKGRNPRSAFYHHSTYADLLITGLIGLRPRADSIIEVDPLLPAGRWEWFRLENVSYRGHNLSIVWDADGQRYGLGPGMHLMVDGEKVASSSSLEPLTGELPE